MPARELLLRLRLDLRLHGGDLELAAQERVHAAQPRQRVAQRQDLLRIAEPQLQVRGDQVREAPRLLHVLGDRQHLGRQALEAEQLLDP